MFLVQLSAEMNVYANIYITPGIVNNTPLLNIEQNWHCVIH